MGKSDSIKSSSEIVYAALVLIVQLCSNIVSGNICVNDLIKCQKNTQQLQALYNAANSRNTPSFDKVKHGMDLCSKQFDYIMECREAMKVVVKHCSKISEGTYVHKICIPIAYKYICTSMCICNSCNMGMSDLPDMYAEGMTYHIA